ncbi:DUF6988 family protein [Variovorax sp. RT4R15]|uniref:DUF6988 family protein n=1 Tax=Variovorax sp. RT4R15 TaxID=3443737 RepID=UPI003F455014
MPIEHLLNRSEALDDAVVALLGGDAYRHVATPVRAGASAVAAGVSLEHARALRVLIANALASSAIALMRLQFEALTRAVWLLHVADDDQIALVLAPLSAETEKSARKLPMVSKMLGALDACPAAGAAAPTAMLNRFKARQLHAFNSFVHGGIHPLQRHRDGCPVVMLLQVLQSSNGLMTMSGMVLAVLTGNHLLATRMNRIHAGYEDCMPELLASY